ncbi:hypothetical protein PFZ55_52530 [Streptomyces sp. MS2A]|nr:hypothetical protein [Streptomyces sp. MS2A]
MTATDPTWFEWISNVAVPALLGLASLFVAIVALRLSAASNRLTKEIHEANSVAASRDERRRLARLIFEWSAQRWRGDPPKGIEEKATLSAIRGVFSVELTQSAEPGAAALQSILWDIDHGVPKDLSAPGYAYFAGAMNATVERIVAQWLKAPEDEQKLREVAATAINQASEVAKSKYPSGTTSPDASEE